MGCLNSFDINKDKTVEDVLVLVPSVVPHANEPFSEDFEDDSLDSRLDSQ